jgi:hypothetical protein
MLTALLVLASTQFEAWMTFSRSPAFDSRVVIVEVGTLNRADDFEYWFKRTVRTSNSKAVWWTDTTRCFGARSVLLAARQLEMPRVEVPFLEKDGIIITADGVGYGLKAKGAYPGTSAHPLEIYSNEGTPLASWINHSLRTLEPCWSTDRPKSS